MCFNVVYRRLTLHRTENARTDTEDFRWSKKRRNQENERKKKKKTNKQTNNFAQFFLPPTFIYHLDTPIFYQLVLSILGYFMWSWASRVHITQNIIFHRSNVRFLYAYRNDCLEHIQNENIRKKRSKIIAIWLSSAFNIHTKVYRIITAVSAILNFHRKQFEQRFSFWVF